jgi:hypothetical protein
VTARKRGPGRPKLPRAEGRTEVVSTYLTPGEKRALLAEAHASGIGLAELVRRLVLPKAPT